MNYDQHQMAPPQQTYVPQYPPADDSPDGPAAQSRTFKILQGLMSNEGESSETISVLRPSVAVTLKCEVASAFRT